MSIFLKERVKRYIKENYGKFSINDVAKRFNVSPIAVEEYIIDELSKELEEKKDKNKPAQDANQGKVFKSINRVLTVVILLGIATLIIALTISQLSNNDIWQHLKNGQMIIQTKKFQYVEPYSCNAAGKPWINEAWLSGVIFYLTYLINGVNGIIYLKSLIILLMVGIVLFNCYRLNINPLLFAPIVILMIFNVGVRFLARTEMFSYVFIAIFFFILLQYKYRRINWRFLIFLPILQVFWSNMHGSFIVSIFILSIFTICETIRLFINRHSSFWQEDLLTWSRLKPLYVTIFFTSLACLVNPYGFKLLAQPFHIVLRNREYIKTIYEWQSPFESSVFRSSYAFKYYTIWMIFLGISFLVDIRHFDLSNLALTGFFFIMAYKMHRNITIFTIATCPIMCLNFQQAFNDFIGVAYNRISQLLLLSGKIILLGILIFLIKLSFKHGYIYRKNSSKPFALGVASNMPIKATKYIKANRIEGCCFNTYTYGTYLIFHCFPETRVTMDSRAEHVYGETFYRRHQRALYNVEIFKDILEEFNIEYILLKYESDQLMKHCRYLNETGQWALVYFDEYCFLYVRRLPKYEKLIARDEYKFINPLLTPQQEKIPPDELNEYIKESERNLSLNPEYFLPHIILLNLYNAVRHWPKVIEHGEALLAQNYKNYSLYILLGKAYNAQDKTNKAKRVYKKALVLRPNSKEALNALKNLNKLENPNSQTLIGPLSST